MNANEKRVPPCWRTNLAGTIKVYATGEAGPEANQELFVFGRSWC